MAALLIQLFSAFSPPFAQDVLTELHDRNEELMAQIAEHKRLLADAESTPSLERLTKPLRCELGVEALGYGPRDAVSTPYGKGVVVAIDDRRKRQAGVIVVVKLDFGTAYLQHGQVQALEKWATKVERAASDDQSAMDVAGQRLMSRFSAVEERLRLAEANVGDIENFLPDDEDEEDAGESSDGLDDEPLAARRAAEHAQAALYIQRGPSKLRPTWLLSFDLCKFSCLAVISQPYSPQTTTTRSGSSSSRRARANSSLAASAVLPLRLSAIPRCFLARRTRFHCC